MKFCHYDVLIVTPGHSMVSGYVKSLTETLTELDRLHISYKWLTGYSSLVHNAREVALSGDMQLNPDDRGPLHDSCTYNKVIWIDSDIVWTVKDFITLYMSPKDIVAGAYLFEGGSSINMDNYPTGVPKEELLSMTQLTKVHSVGFGFISIKSGVFEAIPRPWFGMLNQQIQNSRGENVIISIGEDISWCVKAQHIGYDIYFDPSVLVKHVKSYTYIF